MDKCVDGCGRSTNDSRNIRCDPCRTARRAHKGREWREHNKDKIAGYDARRKNPPEPALTEEKLDIICAAASITPIDYAHYLLELQEIHSRGHTEVHLPERVPGQEIRCRQESA